MSRVRKRHWSIFVGQTGFSIFLLGVLMMGLGLARPQPDAIGDLVASTPYATYADLQLGPGGLLLIEGVVSGQNEALAHGLVAYERSRGVPDIRGDVVWVREEARTPELLIELPGGLVTIEAGYLLFQMRREITDATDRYAGLAVGDTLLAVGRVAGHGAEVRFAADDLIAGSRAEHQPARFDILQIAVGGAFAALGLAVMGWLWGRGYRPFGNYETGR